MHSGQMMLPRCVRGGVGDQHRLGTGHFSCWPSCSAAARAVLSRMPRSCTLKLCSTYHLCYLM